MAVLHYESKLTRRAAQDMILQMAKHGNHHIDIFFKSDADIKRFISAHGLEFQSLVERCRVVTETVPLFENLVGSSWNFVAEGQSNISIRDNATGEENAFQGTGTLTVSTYWAHIEACSKSRDRAVHDNSHSDFQTSAVQGVAAIEAYITRRVKIWNHNESNTKLSDSKYTKVIYDDKIDNWIPFMSNGKRIDKSTIDWNHHRILRSIRDNEAIHPKSMNMGITLQQLAENINMLRAGIGGILIQLHRIFNERIPRDIIRLRYTPDVRVL